MNQLETLDNKFKYNKCLDKPTRNTNKPRQFSLLKLNLRLIKVSKNYINEPQKDQTHNNKSKAYRTINTENSDTENKIKMPSIIKAYQDYNNKAKAKNYSYISKESVKDVSFDYLKTCKSIERTIKVKNNVSNKVDNTCKYKSDLTLPKIDIAKFYFNGKFYNIKSRNANFEPIIL
jgi:hypothetical protein